MKKTTTKIIQKTMLIGATLLMLSGTSRAQAFSEGFDDIYSLVGWDTINNSNPIGARCWLQGYPPDANQGGVFDAYSGATNSFICADFDDGTSTSTLSTWLLTPEASIGNNDTISFYTRATFTGAVTTVYPDRLQVRMSSVSGSNVGTSETSVGDFTTLMLDINPTYTTTDYPLVWTQYSLPVSGLSGTVTGRFAFRYFVENGGPSGLNSFLVAIDDVNYVPFSVGVPLIASHALNLLTYPNPTISQVTFDMGTPIKSNATVTIANEQGQIVGHGIMYTGTKSQILNISNFANGVYSVQVLDNENNLFRSSFVKN